MSCTSFSNKCSVFAQGGFTFTERRPQSQRLWTQTLGERCCRCVSCLHNWSVIRLSECYWSHADSGLLKSLKEDLQRSETVCHELKSLYETSTRVKHRQAFSKYNETATVSINSDDSHGEITTWAVITKSKFVRSPFIGPDWNVEKLSINKMYYPTQSGDMHLHLYLLYYGMIVCPQMVAEWMWLSTEPACWRYDCTVPLSCCVERVQQKSRCLVLSTVSLVSLRTRPCLVRANIKTAASCSLVLGTCPSIQEKLTGSHWKLRCSRPLNELKICQHLRGETNSF